MGSTHPPLESLMTFSQKCLEGFELSRLNHISILRKEFREIVEEWIEIEIEARLARWIFEARQAIGTGGIPDQTTVPELVPPRFVLRALPHGAGHLVPPDDGGLALSFSYDTMFELRDGVRIGVRLPFRRIPVSQDASAALRALEYFARCEAGSIREDPIDLLNCQLPGSLPRCPLLRFPGALGLQPSRKVFSAMIPAPSNTDQLEHCAAGRASGLPVTARAMSVARPGLHIIQRPRRRPTTYLGRRSFAVTSSRSHFPSFLPVRLSQRESSVRRAAVLLRN